MNYLKGYFGFLSLFSENVLQTWASAMDIQVTLVFHLLHIDSERQAGLLIICVIIGSLNCNCNYLWGCYGPQQGTRPTHLALVHKFIQKILDPSHTT